MRGQKKPNKYIVLMSVAAVFVAALGSFLLFSKAKAAVSIDDSLNFASLPGYWRYQANGSQPCPGQSKYDFCASNRMFLEIAQKSGAGAKVNTTLDVKEMWTKSYIDPDRLNSAVIGIYDGKYSRNVFGGNNEYDANGTRQTFNDQQDVIYEFYVAEDTARTVDGVRIYDEVPCTTGAAVKTPFYRADSATMPKNGWAQINVRQRLNASNSGCKTPIVTKKTGKIVIFMRAYWRDPTNTQGRVNAFKVSTAYTDKSSDLANAGLTGYYSDYLNATNRRNDIPLPAEREVGQYAVQNRVDSENTQGRYYFGFAPDCRLPKGTKEKRYIKWKDVDYPDYYPGVAAPRFRLLDVTNSSNPSVVKDINGNDMDLSGSQLGGPNQYQERQVEFTGGRIYEWHWYNITARDGIAFWMPYDDFPALVGGCGNYLQKIGLWGGRNSGGMSQNANQVARGGDTLNLLIDQGWSAPSQPPGQAPFTTSDAFLSTQVGTYDGTFSGVPININEGGSRYNGNRDHIQWKLQGLGPKPTYPDRRWLMYSYQIKENAVDGSKHCFVATMNNETSKQPPLHTGNVATSNQICVTIDNSLKPYLTTAGGDVHAGNDCIVSATNPRTPQTIIGPGVTGTGNGSSGSYVVSAGDRITQFGSGGTAGGTNLSFGKNGYYGSVCRPSLEMLQAELAKGGFESVPGDSATPFNLGSLAPGKRYLVYFAGSGTVYGKANASVTVYSNETVTIQGADFGSGAPAGGTTRANLPTVGVIAKNIKIKREVAGITAQLYATGNINTCSDSTTVACRSVLFLRGFAMAHDFSFKRSGTGSNGLQLAEILGYNAAFQLNPPPGFGTTSGIAKYLGERAPLN